ncbi:hypothetical protein KAR91_05045 [Candidatus Pacearchaeota archaeon]|nr:hypothetical protein [Candidatus Pacearchaeota archaeon]
MIYEANKYGITFGIPNVEIIFQGSTIAAYIEVNDWVSLIEDNQAQSINYERGINGESSMDMNSNSQSVFTLSILQSSPDIPLINDILVLQKTGFVGYPFSIFNNSFADIRRQRSVYSSSAILGQTSQNLQGIGSVWTYRIGHAGGGTFYL